MSAKFKIALTSLLAICFSLLTFSPVGASGTGGYVSGYVYENGSPVNKVEVTVNCTDKDGSTYVHHDKTRKSGEYKVQFNDHDCVSGAEVTASASKDGASGTNSNTMDGGLYMQNLDINLVKASVPEFAPLTAALALTIGAAVIFVIRRQKVNH